MSTRSHLNTQFNVFKNAFCYTIASSILTTNVGPENHSMLVVAIALSVGLLFLTYVISILRGIDASLKGSLFEGPADMIVYLSDTASSVLVNFMSIALGRWALNVQVEASDAMIAVTAGVALLWLVGETAGLNSA